ncbi:circularly permuted type 2 ATP-grasp protein [Rheinheimera sp.]|uniref:circularly permuted type 2 ATP-grasp protein n=1 Tax=Rheinheimera sp. TaxID=1869214 RepID=UPI00273286A7|nr:circularly permuted type 2 ATP-grasp protein [Rheinheimera sp.]MDP2716022.1 circularly permuted type 2 ATP-grasp protein [Rheinheimera sp.]
MSVSVTPYSFAEQQHWQQLPQWQQLQLWWQQQAPERRQQLQADLQHQLRENGAAFAPELQRQLDVLPWLISEPQWQQLEAGLGQRHQLLNAILHDLYGPQLLLQHGIIPPEVIFLNKDYLLPCANLITEQAWLPMLACDIGRDSAGGFCAYADNSRLPAGLGYVLQHRLAFNNTTAGLNAGIKKSQLAGFFRNLQQLLQQGCHSDNGEKLAAILTHHKRDAAYFEHAFLANYLDIALVHGADLLFKDGRLWLKTLSGLQSLQSLLRYLPDHSCDPLELDAAGSGSAGLLQSIRQQQLLCVNPPGSALLDSGALLPFMASCCEFLLQQPLLLATVPALWCGNKQNLAQLQAGAPSYCVQHLLSAEQWLLPQLSQAERTALWQQVQQQPAAYIARQLLPLSTVPCSPAPDNNAPTAALQQLPGVLRLFSLLGNEAGPTAANSAAVSVMPGALGRVCADSQQLQLSDHAGFGRGFIAKDVWVLADKAHAVSLLQSAKQQVTLSRHSGLLPSRVADHLFWLGRYNERLNLICRALRAALSLLSNTEPAAQHDATCLLHFCLQANGSGDSSAPPQAINPTAALDSLFNAANPRGVAAVLQNLLFNAQSVREYFSEDTWYVLDKLQTSIYQWPATATQPPIAVMQRTLDEVVLLQTAIYGLNNETMSRTQTLRFMDLGQHLERALQTCSLLQAVFTHTPPGDALLEALLRLADTLLTYRRRYHADLYPAAIIDLLLLDDSTPRSVTYQCASLLRQAEKLPALQAHSGLKPGREQRLAMALVALLQQADPQQLFDPQQHARPELSLLLHQLQQLLRQLSDSITQSYFNHADLSSQWQSF